MIIIITATKKPSGLVRGDGKHLDGLTLVPWQSGKPLTWDVNVVHTLADSYVIHSSRSAGAAAELAASRKSAKYADLLQSHLFQPIAVETLGSMDSSTTLSLLTWATKYLQFLAKCERPPSYFNIFLFSLKVSTLFFSMIVLLHPMVSRTSHSSALLLAPGSTIGGINKK